MALFPTKIKNKKFHVVKILYHFRQEQEYQTKVNLSIHSKYLAKLSGLKNLRLAHIKLKCYQINKKVYIVNTIIFFKKKTVQQAGTNYFLYI